MCRVTASTSRRAFRRSPSQAGICVTEAVQRAVRDTLGIAMRQLGPQSLKNITEPVEVFAIEVNGPPLPVSAELPPARSEVIQPFTEASVAVLPLDNLSRDPRNGHLCDGFTGDIITNLSPLSRSPGDRAAFGIPVQESRPAVLHRSPANWGSVTS